MNRLYKQQRQYIVHMLQYLRVPKVPTLTSAEKWQEREGEEGGVERVETMWRTSRTATLITRQMETKAKAEQHF